MDKRDNAFDGLRGFLAIRIFLWHYYVACMEQNSIIPYKLWFTFSVSCFFFISGYFSSKKLSYIENVSLLKYLKNRFKHIYPSVFITTLIAFLLCVFATNYYYEEFVNIGVNKTISVFKLIRSLFMVDSGWVSNENPYNGLLWYINVSMLCYIIYWIVAHITHKNKKMYFAACLFVFVVSCANYLIGAFNFPFFYLGDSIGISFFFLGVITGVIADKYSKINTKFLCLSFISLVISECYYWRYSKSESALYVYIIIISLMLLVIYCNQLRKIFSLYLFQFFGKISFSIYILHNMIIYLVKGISLHYGLNIDFSNPCIIIVVLMNIIFISYMWDKYIVKKITFWK